MIRVRHVEEVMGTGFTVDGVFNDRDRDDALATLAAFCAELHRVDKVFSTWRVDSVVSRFRRGELSPDQLPQEVKDVLTSCERAKAVSGGWFDPWVAPGGIDPTGYVKGWAGQRLLDALRSAGAVAALVNAAGDVAGFGEPDPGRPWRLGLTDPFAKHEVLGAVSIRDTALAVSGTYERGDHVFDPQGGPARAGVVSTAVMGPDLGFADALATALVAGGEEAFDRISALSEHEALVIFADGRQLRSSAFPLAQ